MKTLKIEVRDALQQYEALRVPKFCALINEMKLQPDQSLCGVAQLMGIPYSGFKLILRARSDVILLFIAVEALGKRALDIRNLDNECADHYDFETLSKLIFTVDAMRKVIAWGGYQLRGYSILKPFAQRLQCVFDELTVEQKRLEGFQ